MHKTETLTELRQEIDHVDERLIQLLAERQALVDRIVVVKQEKGLPARVPERIEEVLAQVRRRAKTYHVHEKLVHTVWHAMIEWFVAHEEEILKGKGQGEGKCRKACHPVLSLPIFLIQVAEPSPQPEK